MEPDPAYQMVEALARKHKVPMAPVGYRIERPYASREIVMGAADLINEANPDRESDLMRQLADQVTSSSLPHPVRTGMDTQPFRVIDDVEFETDEALRRIGCVPSGEWERIPGISDPEPEGSDVAVTSPKSIFGPGFADGGVGMELCDPNRPRLAQASVVGPIPDDDRPNPQGWEVVTTTPEDVFGPGFHDEPSAKATDLSGDGIVVLPARPEEDQHPLDYEEMREGLPPEGA